MLVEVPDTAHSFVVDNNGYLLMSVPGSQYTSDQYSLDDWIPTKCEVVGKGNELSDEQWKGIVPPATGGFFGNLSGYKDFTYQMAMDISPLKTATESGYSMIKSHFMKPETTLLLKLP